MNSTCSINPKRLMLLIRSYIFTNINLILVLTAVFSALIIIDAVVDSFMENNSSLYQANYFLLLFVSGFVITRQIGIELHDIRKGSTWLLLPASTLEKFLTLLLLPTLILICAAAVYMTIVSIVIEQGIGFFISTNHKLFNPFNPAFLKGLNIYIIIQAPFLLGVIYFRKRGMSYTFLSFFIYCVILLIFTFVAGRFLIGEYLAPLKDMSNSMGIEVKLYVMNMIEKYLQVNSTWEPVISSFFSYVFAPVCWITAFFTLKETEL